MKEAYRGKCSDPGPAKLCAETNYYNSLGLSFLHESENSGGIPEGRVSAQYFFGFIFPAKNSGCHIGWLIHVHLNGWPLPALEVWLMQEADTAFWQSSFSLSHQSQPQRRWFRAFVSSKYSSPTVLAGLVPFFGNLGLLIPTLLHHQGYWAIRTWSWPQTLELSKSAFEADVRFCSFSSCTQCGVREKIPWCMSLFTPFSKKGGFFLPRLHPQ